MDFGIYLTFRNPRLWRRPIADIYRDQIADAVHAEKLGYGHVWTSEHHFRDDAWSSSLFPILGSIAGQTRQVRLGTYIYAGARLDPENCTAFWSSGALCGPRISIALRDLVRKAKETGDWSAAKRLSEEIGKAGQTLFPHGSFHEFSMYNIGIVKERVNAAGWMKAGPNRPPYHVVPDDIRENARIAGRRWAELEKRLPV